MNIRRHTLRSLAAIGLTIASCATAAPTPPLASQSAAPSPAPWTSSYGRLFAQVEDDGSVTKEMALQAFSLAIAPLPGVELPPADEPPLYERVEGTFAIRWVQRYYDELTPEQKAVVDTALTPAADSVVIEPPTEGSTRHSVALVAFDTSAADPSADPATFFVTTATAAMGVIAVELHRPLAMNVGVQVNAVHQHAKASALAYAWLAAGPLGKPQCQIAIEPELLSYDPVAQKVTVAHEVFHCFQFDLYRKKGSSHANVPDWLIEGQAEWAGEAIFGPSVVGHDWWERYLESPGNSVFGRTYDAVGFYEHLSRLGMATWTAMDPMLDAATVEAAFRAANAQEHSFLDSWASGLFRDPQLPQPDWNEPGRWETAASAVPIPLLIENGGDADLTVPAGTNLQVIIGSDADLLQIDLQGHSRTRAGGSEWIDLTTLLLCTKTGGCACPDGSSYEGPPFETSDDRQVRIGLTGGAMAAAGTLDGLPLDQFCQPKGSAKPGGGGSGPPCPTGCASTMGEPHLTTVDGVGYDFQAAGEYVLLRSSDGSVEIQARQIPRTTASGAAVSANSAVAASVAGHRVGVYATGEGLQVRVDGEVVTLSEPMDLGPGGTVAAYANGAEIDFPDGTRLFAVSPRNVCCINVMIDASEALTSDGQGLLGNVTAGVLQVPALPDGTRLPRAENAHERFVAVYEQLGPAWLITDDSSLFDYEPGMSTADFLVEGFPAEPEIRTIEDLTPEERATGESACTAVSDRDLFLQCVFDVSITDLLEWAELYAVTDQFVVEVRACLATSRRRSPTWTSCRRGSSRSSGPSWGSEVRTWA